MNEKIEILTLVCKFKTVKEIICTLNIRKKTDDSV